MQKPEKEQRATPATWDYPNYRVHPLCGTVRRIRHNACDFQAVVMRLPSILQDVSTDRKQGDLIPTHKLLNSSVDLYFKDIYA